MGVWWRAVAVMTGAGALWMITASTTPSAPALAGKDLGPEIAELEARVSRAPADDAALQGLVTAYLAHAAPGLAQAAIDRAPPEVRAQPAIADARARTLAELGAARVALAVQREALRACRAQSCSPELIGRGEHRARVLSQLVRLGVEDPATEPHQALLAYRLAVREVRLDMN